MNSKLFTLLLILITVITYYYIRNTKITLFIVTFLCYVYFFYYGHTTYDNYLTYRKLIYGNSLQYKQKYIKKYS